MKLFSKIKDYNNSLEKILDKKTFSSTAKSLLQSMISKLDISYNDYSKVKIDIISKEEFFQNLLNIIDKHCDNIKTVKPESIQANLLVENNVEAVTNLKERSILVYPTEKAMLYAICDIEPKFFYVRKNFILKNVLQKVLVEGYKQNTLEILNNFNGWTWDLNAKNEVNYISNLIYQNIMMILGENFLYNWKTDQTSQRGYLQELRRSIKSITGNDNYYLSLCRLLYLIAERNEKIKIKKILEEKYKKFTLMLKQPEEIRKKYNREFNELRDYSLILKNDASQYEELAKLQKEFIYIIEKTIKRLQTKEEILEVIYCLRYYQNMNFFEDVKIKEYSQLQDDLNNVLKLAITKACKMNVIKVVSRNIDTNFEIIRYILDTKIIKLEDIKVYLEIEENNIFIKVYDKDLYEKQGKTKFSR